MTFSPTATQDVCLWRPSVMGGRVERGEGDPFRLDSAASRAGRTVVLCFGTHLQQTEQVADAQQEMRQYPQQPAAQMLHMLRPASSSSMPPAAACAPAAAKAATAAVVGASGRCWSARVPPCRSQHSTPPAGSREAEYRYLHPAAITIRAYS